MSVIEQMLARYPITDNQSRSRALREVMQELALEFTTQQHLLLQPYSFYVKCFSPADLFAGKMHALLFRKWKNRVKGRDWYDLEWYVRQGYPLNLRHFTVRAIQSGDLASGTRLDAEAFQALLKNRIATLDVASARADVSRFLSDPQVLDIWSRDYFRQLAQRIRYA